MTGKLHRSTRWPAIGAIATTLVVLAVACGSSSSTAGGGGGGGNQQAQPPTAKMATPTSIGTGEGQLNLIAWEGYAQPLWVKPFQAQTGCHVNAKYDGTSNAVGADMAGGGGGGAGLRAPARG